MKETEAYEEKNAKEKSDEKNNEDNKVGIDNSSSVQSQRDYQPQNQENLRQYNNYRRFYRRRQKQIVPAYIDWKDVDYLKRFVPERSKIMPRRISGVSAKDQRRIARAIKRARIMALLPYVEN